MAKEWTTIGLTKKTKNILAGLVSYKGESYENIILRLLKEQKNKQ